MVSSEFFVFSESVYVIEKKGRTFLVNKGGQVQKVADGGFITKMAFFYYFHNMRLRLHRRIEGRGFNWGRLASMGKVR